MPAATTSPVAWRLALIKSLSLSMDQSKRQSQMPRRSWANPLNSTSIRRRRRRRLRNTYTRFGVPTRRERLSAARVDGSMLMITAISSATPELKAPPDLAVLRKSVYNGRRHQKQRAEGTKNLQTLPVVDWEKDQSR